MNCQWWQLFRLRTSFAIYNCSLTKASTSGCSFGLTATGEPNASNPFSSSMLKLHKYSSHLLWHFVIGVRTFSLFGGLHDNGSANLTCLRYVLSMCIFWLTRQFCKLQVKSLSLVTWSSQPKPNIMNLSVLSTVCGETRAPNLNHDATETWG